MVDDSTKDLENTATPSPKKGRWARTAEEMSNQGILKGNGEDLLKDIREFRDDFEIGRDGE